MKSTLLKTVILIVVFSSSLMSCKDDEETQKNSFKYNQKVAEIGTVYGFEDGESYISGVYSITMLLFEKTLTVHYKNGIPDSLSGRGDVLVINFLTDKKDEITSGEYSLNSSTSVSKAFTIDTDESAVLVNVESYETIPAASLALSSGKVSLVKNGEDYEITINMNSDVNSTVTGYYKGKSIIYSELKKKSGKARIFIPLSKAIN